MFVLNNFFLLATLSRCLITKYQWIYILKYNEQIKHASSFAHKVLPLRLMLFRWRCSRMTPLTFASYIFTHLISFPLKLLKNDEMWNWDQLHPLWTKIESPKVVYFAGTGDGRDGEGGENWGESLGENCLNWNLPQIGWNWLICAEWHHNVGIR